MLNRIDEHFISQKEKNKKSLIIYLTAGFPDEKITKKLLPVLVENGADLIELGVPFSDPIADGPTIQKASEIALANGISLKKILKIVEGFRKDYSNIPLILFGAYNPFFRYGLKEIARDAKNAGADGFLSADLPPEEGEEFRSICLNNSLRLVYLIAPTTPKSRQKFIASKSSGFIYYVSVKGVTGQRTELSSDIEEHVLSIKKITDKPLAVGFGVSKPEHVKYVSGFADGVVVGSAVISEIMKNKTEQQIIQSAASLIKNLSSPLKS